MRGARRNRWAVALAAALLLAGSGCGGASSAPRATSGGAPGGSGAGAAAASTGASSSPAKLSGPLAALYAKAKQEGTVVFQGVITPNLIQPLLASFEKTYPGVHVQYVAVTSAQEIPEILAQEKAHQVQEDLTQLHFNYEIVKMQSAMASVDWGSLGVPAEQDYNNQFLFWRDTIDVVAYNTQNVKGNAIPKQWNDLLKPQFAAGKLAVDARGNFGTVFYLDPSMGASAAVAYGQKLAAQKPLWEARMNSALQAIISGEALAGTTDVSTLLNERAKGAPVAVAPVSPVVATPDGLAVLAGAPHPAAAELLGAWLVSGPARAQLDKAAYYGLATPCSASQQAKYLCSLNVKVLTLDTLKEAQGDVRWQTQFQQALGTYKGKSSRSKSKAKG